MKSLSVSVADAIVEFLNNQTFGDRSLEAERKLIVERSLMNSRSLRCVCVPHRLTSEIVARNAAKERIVTVDIGFMQRCAESELEALIDLIETIGDAIEGIKILNGRCIGVEYSPIYDADVFLQQSCFFSIIQAKVKVLI